jgi:phosphoglycolate phosphatase
LNTNTIPQAILFDLDGTLLDSAPDFIFCLNLLREKYRLPALAPDLIREKVSDGANAMIKLAFNLDKDDKKTTQTSLRTTGNLSFTLR